MQPPCKSYWRFLIPLKMKQPYDPGYHIWRDFQKNKFILPWRHCVGMFITALSKKPQHPSVDWWIKKMWNKHNRVLHRHKENEVVLSQEKWIWGYHITSISQSFKEKQHVFIVYVGWRGKRKDVKVNCGSLAVWKGLQRRREEYETVIVKMIKTHYVLMC